MGKIKLNTEAGGAKIAQADFAEAKANLAIAQVDADLNLIDAATTAQLKAILKRSLRRERKILRFLKNRL